jgi:hypothetical protein
MFTRAEDRGDLKLAAPFAIREGLKYKCDARGFGSAWRGEPRAAAGLKFVGGITGAQERDLEAAWAENCLAGVVKVTAVR